eukprot:4818348-Pyramimonas_sp.AAC.1
MFYARLNNKGWLNRPESLEILLCPPAPLTLLPLPYTNMTSSYGSSCANNGEGALNTPVPLPYTIAERSLLRAPGALALPILCAPVLGEYSLRATNQTPSAENIPRGRPI